MILCLFLIKKNQLIQNIVDVLRVYLNNINNIWSLSILKKLI